MKTVSYKLKVIYPKSYVRWVEKNLKYADIHISVENFLTTSFSLSFVFSVLIALLLHILNFSPVLILIGFISTFLIFHLAINGGIIFMADRRASFAEEVFPDLLQLVAANLRTGLTPEKALILAARPEFGLLEEEIRIVAKKIVSGIPIEDAIADIGKKIKSKLILKTLNLIKEGIRKGGELAGLLDQTAEDIRHTKILRKEISAQVTMYVIFIFLAAGIIAPLLFAISTHLVKTMMGISEVMGIEKIVTIGGKEFGFMTFGMVKISPKFLEIYALSALLITSFFGSFLLGLLKEGKEIAGLKLLPMLILLNLLVFFGGRILVEKLLVGFIPSV
jgi:flagellar protein FlaJ